MKFNPLPFHTDFIQRGLAFALNTIYDVHRPMGNVAASDLSDVLCAWLVGLHNPIAPVVSRSLEWLELAINEDEDFGTSRNYHRLTLHIGKALGLWMRDNVNDVDAWNNARLFSEAAIQDDAWQKNKIATLWLDDYMAYCYQAEQYDAGIAEFEKFYGVKTISLKKTPKPREFVYALCVHRTRKQFDENALLEAGRKMLQENLEETWLGAGQYIRATIWLKIVYWHNDRSLTPLQTVLKAYDDMKNVPKPESIT